MIYLDQNSDGIQSGNFPANDQELLLGPGAAEHYQMQTARRIQCLPITESINEL